MMTYRVLEYSSLTKESVERDATASEVADFKAREKKIVNIQAEAEAKASAKAALLAKLGITEDEAKLLLS
jgi:hypothetical protein